MCFFLPLPRSPAPVAARVCCQYEWQPFMFNSPFQDLPIVFHRLRSPFTRRVAVCVRFTGFVRQQGVHEWKSLESRKWMSPCGSINIHSSPGKENNDQLPCCKCISAILPFGMSMASKPLHEFRSVRLLQTGSLLQTVKLSGCSCLQDVKFCCNTQQGVLHFLLI